MKYCNNESDKQLLELKTNDDLKLLLKKYNSFLNKYFRLLVYETIDFKNYDIRFFISLYMKDKELKRSIRRGKYHSSEAIYEARKIVRKLNSLFKNYTLDDIYYELTIPFVQCVLHYQFRANGFEKYLYQSYRFYLHRHLKDLAKEQNFYEIAYFDDINGKTELIDFDQLESDYLIEMEPDLELNHPDWLNGKKASYPFNQLTREQRLILVKYYMEKYKDRQIGQLIGRNPKSIHRIRSKIVRKMWEKIIKGDIKWARKN